MPRKTAVSPGVSRMASSSSKARRVLDLDGPDHLVTRGQVLGRRGEAPPAGAGCRTHPPPPGRREDHLLDRSSRFGRAGHLGHEDPVGAGVQQPLDVAPAAVRHPDEHGEPRPWATTMAWYAKSRVSGLCSMSTTTNSKPAAARSSRVSRLGSLTHVPNVVGPGPRRPAGTVTASGTRRGSAPSPAAGRSPCGVGRRCRQLVVLVVHALAGVDRGRRDDRDGRAAQSWCSSSRQWAMFTVHGVRMWWTYDPRAATRSARSRRGGGATACSGPSPRRPTAE